MDAPPIGRARRQSSVPPSWVQEAGEEVLGPSPIPTTGRFVRCCAKVEKTTTERNATSRSDSRSSVRMFGELKRLNAVSTPSNSSAGAAPATPIPSRFSEALLLL